MQLPLSFWDISLCLAVTAIILLAIAGLVSPYSKKISLVIERKRLKQAALILGILFLITVTIRMCQMTT